jgi:hypothetical protein
MDIGRPFKAIFRDPRWFSKMLLQAVFMFIPIVNFATSGFTLEYQKHVAYGRDEQLPEWGDFGKHWVAGFLIFVAGLIYALPMIVIIMLGVAMIVGGAVSGSEDATAGGVLCGTMLIVVASIVYGIALAAILPAAMTNYNNSREFGDFFRIGEIWSRLRDNAGAYFGAYGMGLVINFAVSFITTPITYLFMAIGGAVFAVGIEAGGEEAAPAAFCGFFLLMMVGYLITIALYVPVGFIWFHYFGQYMAKAYGLPGVATPSPAPAAGGAYGGAQSGDVLPPPPPAGTTQAPPPPQGAPPPPPPPPDASAGDSTDSGTGSGDSPDAGG